MNNNRHAVMMEKRQEIMRQKIEAGLIATNFPEVSNIDMNMTYNQTGTKSILRAFHFTSSSYAFFVFNCLRKDCIDGGFDLTQVITKMIRNHRAQVKGVLSCKGTDSSINHSDIVYEVSIQYTSIGVS